MIDTGYSFACDTDGYWDSFWANDRSLTPKKAPDIDKVSNELRKSHKFLWSKRLPNGRLMDITFAGRKTDYLVWSGFRFGSDSITTSFRYARYQNLFTDIKSSLGNGFDAYIYDYMKSRQP